MITGAKPPRAREISRGCRYAGPGNVESNWWVPLSAPDCLVIADPHAQRLIQTVSRPQETISVEDPSATTCCIPETLMLNWLPANWKGSKCRSF